MKRVIAIIIVVLFIAGLVLGFGAGFLYPHQEAEKHYAEVFMALPAVRASGDGMTANLTTVVKPGGGQVLVNINEIFAGYETQRSARVASKVASNFTGESLDNVDLIYTIQADASSIEGPSAGAAMTISAIAALKGKELNKSIMMTGSIKENGDIGRASGLAAKIKVSQDTGATLFLIPEGQIVTSELRKEQTCDRVHGVKYCRIDYVENTSHFDVEVREVANVEEAWGYFV